MLYIDVLVDKKPSQPRVSGGDRNVKFSGESREERNNRRNREDGERTLRGQGEFRRGPPGLVSAKQATNVIRYSLDVLTFCSEMFHILA